MLDNCALADAVVTVYLALLLTVCAGIYHKVPFSQQEWNEWALTPPDDGTLDFIFELGKADAAAWAKHSGYVQATATSSKAKSGGRRLLAAGSAAQ